MSIINGCNIVIVIRSAFIKTLPANLSEMTFFSRSKGNPEEINKKRNHGKYIRERKSSK